MRTSLTSRFVGVPASIATTKMVRSLALLGLLAAGTISGAAAQAAGPAVRLTQPKPASLRLRIDNAARLPGRVQVLSQADGQTLYSEAYQAPAYGHRFDFAQLPAGRYTVLLSVGPDRYRYTVQLQNEREGSTLVVREVTTRQVQPVLATAGSL